MTPEQIADMKAKALANLSIEAEYFSLHTEKHSQEILTLIAALEAANQRADAAEASVSAERVKLTARDDLLEDCFRQFNFYVTQHERAAAVKKALVNREFADRIKAVMAGSCRVRAGRIAELEGQVAALREAIEPFAKAASILSFALGPDGVDSGYTVLLETVVSATSQELSTAHFTKCARVYAETAPTDGGA